MDACAFCDRAQFEERLVFENKDNYIITTLGQITNGGYILIAPKKHVPCLGALTFDGAHSVFELAKKAYRALSAEYEPMPSKDLWPIIMFEHGIVGQSVEHAHLHIAPMMIDLTPQICKDFPLATVEKLESPLELQRLYSQNPRPYLFWTTPRDAAMVCWDPPAPLQYLRLIAAKFAGHPERGNWRNMNPELDKTLWQDTVRRLKPYFQNKLNNELKHELGQPR